MKNAFEMTIKNAYQLDEPSLLLGTAIQDGEPIPQLNIHVPLKMMNRHGLIAGATGTGKTKTIQVLVEQLSHHGVPCVVMDFKGDLTGLGQPGTINSTIEQRMAMMGQGYSPCGFPVDFFSLSHSQGVNLRTTLYQFGPLLLSRLLELNDNQSGLVAVIFKYCVDHNLPLIDLTDFKSVLTLFESEQRINLEKEYGRLSSSSVATLRRKIIALEQEGVASFFGEPSLQLGDLVQLNVSGHGKISLICLSDIQNQPQLISCFMLSLLSDIYESFPELGDCEKPKLMLFIDEAHLLFENASTVLIDKIQNIVKLIRSKGVGLIFCTQTPDDIPSPALSQLGLKIQHALRAFTAKDRKAIKLASENYPESEYYDMATLITSLGIGEAAITALDVAGRPTPLVVSMLPSPQSSMLAMEDIKITEHNARSDLVKKYHQSLNRESASEMLNKKMDNIENSTSSRVKTEANTMLSTLSKNTLFRQIVNTLFRELIKVITQKR